MTHDAMATPDAPFTWDCGPYRLAAETGGKLTHLGLGDHRSRQVRLPVARWAYQEERAYAALPSLRQSQGSLARQ